MTKIERLKKLCKWLIFIGYAENDADLASKLGYTKSSFSQIMNEKVPISVKFIDKICSAGDNINKVWINTGQGKLINDTNDPSELNNLYEKIKFQEEQIEWYKKQLKYLTD